MKFKCPSCDMQLKAEPEMAGKIVRCPGCNTKLSIPASVAAPSPAAGGLPPPSGLPAPSGVSAPDSPPAGDAFGNEYEHGGSAPQDQLGSSYEPKARGGWEETDPANPNPWMALAIGAVSALAWFGSRQDRHWHNGRSCHRSGKRSPPGRPVPPW